MTMKKENELRQELREMSKPSFDMIACAQEMQMFSQAYIQGGVQAFSQNAYEDLNEMVKSYRRLRKEIAGISKTMQENVIYECGIFIGAYKIFEEINRINARLEEHYDAQKLLDRKHVPAILMYLYENPDARQSVIAEKIDISPSYLSEILNLLMQAGYVTRYGKSKNTRYRLAKTGRIIYKKRFMQKEKQEAYIDTDYKEIISKEHFIRERIKEDKKNNYRKEEDYEKWKEDFRTNTGFAIYR